MYLKNISEINVMKDQETVLIEKLYKIKSNSWMCSH